MYKNVVKLTLLFSIFAIVFVLTGCDTEHYNEPIEAVDPDAGFTWMQAIVTFVADRIYDISQLANGYYIVGLVVVTLIIRLIGWPIYSKSTAMSANMQIAQPELEKLKEKYQDKKDEASQRQYQQEMLQIYRKYNINPLGCLFPFLQMPIFIAMYQTVRRMPLVERFGHTDKYADLNFEFLFMDFAAESPVLDTAFNLQDHWINVILAAIVGVIMFFYQRYAMKRPDFMQNKKYQSAQAEQTQNMMKYMMFFMVFMLVAISFTNLGIAVYWIIGNIFQFVQTYVNRKRMYKKHFAKESA